mmetsp:Transcript_16471/g.25407  ORF Transcript_16471/g.25407 Transcript_16471/m.25407 type:complete len:103 (+) Transcript_16471:177-485(+)
MNSYEKASIAAQRIRDEKDALRREREQQSMERLKAINKAQHAKQRRNKILGMRNKKGQPLLNKQMVLLLEQIQQNNKQQKPNRRHNSRHNTVRDDDDDMNDF